MDLSFYEEKFDSFVSDYGDGSDRSIVEEINKELGKVWPFYVLAGVDPTKLAEMMSDKDVWYYYDSLTKSGAKIDIHRFIRKASVRFINENRKLFIERGATEHELKEACSRKRERG